MPKKLVINYEAVLIAYLHFHYIFRLNSIEFIDKTNNSILEEGELLVWSRGY